MNESVPDATSDRVAEPVAAGTPLEAVDIWSLLRLAWPIVVSRSSQAVIGLCDALMVAQLGEVALAASTTGAMNTLVLLILPMGLCFIVSSYSAQMFGRGDRVGARRYGFYGLAVAVTTQLACFALVPFLGPLLTFTGAFDADVHAGMAAYMSYRLLGGGAVVGFEALSNYYGGLGNTQLPMRVSLLMMVANVALNAVLIFGLLGVPALGVIGAAIGSLLSAMLGFGVMLFLFVQDGRRIGRVVPRLYGAELLRMVRFGLPAGLNWFFEFMAFIFFVDVVVANLGTTTLAAFMTGIELNSVSFMPAFGIASAGAILVGQRIGAGDLDAVNGVVRRTFLVSGGWQTFVSLLYLTMPQTIFSVFVSQTGPDAEKLLAMGAFVVMCSASWQLCDAAATTLAEALRAAGDTDFTLWARLGIGWLIFVPGSYYTVRVLKLGVGVAVVWLVVYLGLLAAVLYVRYRSGIWRKIALIDPSSP